MKTFALIKAGMVFNVILAEQPFIDAKGVEMGATQCVDLTDLAPRPGPGWTYSAATGKFTAGA